MEEDTLLDKMDDVWFNLTDEEPNIGRWLNGINLKRPAAERVT